MKKIILGLVLAVAASCEYNNLQPRLCYLVVEETPSKTNYYTYNSNNELISYSGPNVFSSTLTNDATGKIISELDNENIQINYTYDQNNLLTLWSETVTDYPVGNLQVKFMYNTAGQDTLQQYFRYDVSASSYFLVTYVRLSYASPRTKNYSQRKTYDAYSNLRYTEDFLWDNHPNPYLANAFFVNEPPPSNNIVQYTYTQAGYSPIVIKYSYVYNHTGFPISQTTIGYGTTVNYTYTNCN